MHVVRLVACSPVSLHVKRKRKKKRKKKKIHAPKLLSYNQSMSAEKLQKVSHIACTSLGRLQNCTHSPSCHNSLGRENCGS